MITRGFYDKNIRWPDRNVLKGGGRHILLEGSDAIWSREVFTIGIFSDQTAMWSKLHCWKAAAGKNPMKRGTVQWQDKAFSDKIILQELFPMVWPCHLQSQILRKDTKSHGLIWLTTDPQNYDTEDKAFTWYDFSLKLWDRRTRLSHSVIKIFNDLNWSCFQWR